jgi:hypothetical protein|uniref:Uncharacterized protein n=1 Tax=viral metagenome TaxID=1070528 RepID=A0A6C0CCL5_9ZZZZ
MLRKLITNSTNFFLISRFKHSHIIYNTLTKSLLIDNSLKKDLEMAQKRKLRNTKIKYNDTKEQLNSFQIVEMSESHNVQPYVINKNK